MKAPPMKLAEQDFHEYYVQLMEYNRIRAARYNSFSLDSIIWGIFTILTVLGSIYGLIWFCVNTPKMLGG